MDMLPLRLTSSARKEEEMYLANLLQLLCTQQQEAPLALFGAPQSSIS